MRDVPRDRSTTPEQAQRASAFALGELMRATAREISTGRMEMSDVKPTLELMARVAEPMPEMAGRLRGMADEWDREKLADVDVVADLRHFAKGLAPAPARTELPASKGPAEVEAPMASPDRGAGR